MPHLGWVRVGALMFTLHTVRGTDERREHMTRTASSTRVLVVEDDPSTALMILAELGRMHCSVSLVENGLMAVRAWLSALDEQPFDVVVMDINMPVMSGEAAMHEIRRMEVDLTEPRTPILAFSASDDTARTRHWLEMGFDAVLSKPAQLHRLLAVVQDLTGKTSPAT
ncbi:MAG: response regulator [Aquabacterium sp.]|nr:MAG: response regulator [Aquabacterium sp.]